MTDVQERLILRNVSKTFRPSSGPPVEALRAVDLTVCGGDFVVIVGHNGSGKSTLLNIIAGVVAADAGDVEFEDGAAVSWNRLPAADRAKRVGRVYQNPTDNVVGDLTVAENVALVLSTAAIPAPWRRAVPRGFAARCDSLMADVGLEGRAEARARDLSFGQQQLLALQLAFLREPTVLLLDEPTAALDRRNAARCLEFLDQHRRRDRQMVVMVTHDLGVALRVGNRLVILRDGALAEDLDAGQKASLTVERLFTMCGFGTTSPARG